MPLAASQLLKAIKERKCILFLGAGVHYPPPPALPQYQYPSDQRPPLGTALSRSLVQDTRQLMRLSFPAKATALPEERQKAAAEARLKLWFLRRHGDNLQRTSWYYEVEHQRMALVSFVKTQVNDGKVPSALVRGLIDMNFPVVITTNYDQLFETAHAAWSGTDAGRGATLKPCVYDPNPAAATPEYHHTPGAHECWLLKIHGCVSKPESIVITDEDYVQFIMRMNAEERHHPIPARMRALLSEWTTLFVGYSLLDYNLRLLFRTLRWRLGPAIRPPTFSVDRSPDYLIRATYEKSDLVSFIARDMWRFVPELYQRVMGRPMPP
jgi:hypothetical protein